MSFYTIVWPPAYTNLHATPAAEVAARLLGKAEGIMCIAREPSQRVMFSIDPIGPGVAIAELLERWKAEGRHSFTVTTRTPSAQVDGSEPVVSRTPVLHPATALGQWQRERDALVQCARAFAFSYGGTRREDHSDLEDLASWDAMHAAYDALGVHDTRNLPAATA